jgi:hypothetical protein
MEVAIDAVESAVGICNEVTGEYPHSCVFTGQITFRLEKVLPPNAAQRNNLSHSTPLAMGWPVD